jgi:hypothetical protein
MKFKISRVSYPIIYYNGLSIVEHIANAQYVHSGTEPNKSPLVAMGVVRPPPKAKPKKNSIFFLIIFGPREWPKPPLGSNRVVGSPKFFFFLKKKLF